MAFDLPQAPDLDDPLLSFRFSVFFMGKVGVDHPLDFRFQSVSGITATVELGKPLSSGPGINPPIFPESVNYSNLVLERGLPLISTLGAEIQNTLDSFRFRPRNVLVSILDEGGISLNSWVFMEAFPVKWSLSQLNAERSEVIVESMELNYKKFKPMYL